MITIKIENLSEIKAAFRRAPIKMTQEIHRAVQRSVLKIERNIKREAPVNKQKGGGNLRQKIKSRMEGYSRGVVEAGAEYSAAVEYGTKPHIIRVVNKKVLANKRTNQIFGKVVRHPGTKANPFFKRGVDNSRTYVREQFVKAVQNALK